MPNPAPPNPPVEGPPATGETDPPADPPKAPEKAPGDAGDPPGADALGDAGKKALDAMKAERNQARQAAQAASDELARLRAEAEGRAEQHAAELKAREVEAAALSKANDRILRAELRATAAGKLADPADALRFIDMSEFEVGPDGEVDQAALAAAVNDLIETKPYLAAQGGQRFQGTVDGGARNGPPVQSIDEQIAEATRTGNTALSIYLKQQKQKASAAAPST